MVDKVGNILIKNNKISGLKNIKEDYQSLKEIRKNWEKISIKYCYDWFFYCCY